MAREAAVGLTPHHRPHEVRGRAAEAERVVDANLAVATPCVLTVPILLNCTTASALAGEEDEARRLESKARGIGMKGNRWYQGWFEPPRIRLALTRHELGEIAELTPPEFDWDWEPSSTFLGALRALGIARDDRALLQQALERFEAMGLSWHAEQTRRLL
jgi:hypothetical protein